jgi:hypothetical protein
MDDSGIPVDGGFDRTCRIYEIEKFRNIVPYEGAIETLRGPPGSGPPHGDHDRRGCKRCGTSREKPGCSRFLPGWSRLIRLG